MHNTLKSLCVYEWAVTKSNYRNQLLEYKNIILTTKNLPFRNKNVFNLDLNWSKDVMSLRDCGREFHSSGAALANALSLNSLVLTRIWLSRFWELERKLRFMFHTIESFSI